MHAPPPSFRRRLRVAYPVRWCAFLLSAAAGLQASGVPPPAVNGAQHTVIHRQSGQYSAFPRLYLLVDGTLYVHFGAGVTSSHLEPRREPMRFISKDNGRTWEQSTREEPNPAWATGLSHPGRLVDPSAHAWRYVEPARRAEFERQDIEVRNSPDGRVTYAYGCYVRTSQDRGARWRQTEISIPSKALVMGFLDPATDLRLDDRTLLCAVYGKPTANVRFYEAWLLRSEDDGRTWDFLTLAADPEKQRSFGETAIARAANGDIVAMMRTEPALGSKMWLARSTDRGRTWSRAVETPLHGHPPTCSLCATARCSARMAFATNRSAFAPPSAVITAAPGGRRT